MADSHRSRRRFQFRLRTLLIVVTLNCLITGWLGMQATVVWQRRAMLSRIPGGYAVDDDGAGISWVRHLFGDRGIGLIHLVGFPTDDELERYRAAFPEACIYRTRQPLRISRGEIPIRFSRSYPVMANHQ